MVGTGNERTVTRFAKSIEKQIAVDAELTRQIRSDNELRDLMKALLKELKISNLHYSTMTNDVWKESDV